MSSPIKGEAIVLAIAVERHLHPSGQERPSQQPLIKTKMEQGPFPRWGEDGHIGDSCGTVSSPIKGEAAVSAMAVDWRLPPLGQERPS